MIFARLLKQYSAELAASVSILLAAHFYFKSRSNQGFLFLLSTSLAGIALGYGLAFMLPSLLSLMIWPLLSAESTIEVKRKSLLHASCFMLLTAATLISEYYYFVPPNSSDALTYFWQHASIESLPDFLVKRGYQLFQRSLPFLPEHLSLQNPKHWLVVCPLALALASGLTRSFTGSVNTTFRILAYATISALLVADRLGIYPAIDRTSFFTLPLSVILLADGHLYRWAFPPGTAHNAALNLLARDTQAKCKLLHSKRLVRIDRLSH